MCIGRFVLPREKQVRQLTGILLAVLYAPMLIAQDGVKCNSDDGRRHYCDIDTSRGVRLSRQISGTACIEGSTWGYDRRGVWVDRGCRATFVARAGQDDYRGNDRRAYNQELVRCNSDDERRHYCSIDTRGGVRLVNQLSGTPCTEGETWGFDDRGVWVDHGCRADFSSGGRRR